MIDRSKTTQGGNQVLHYEYRILVSSYKPRRSRLQVWDRLPNAENETVGVTLIKARAGAQQGRALSARTAARATCCAGT